MNSSDRSSFISLLVVTLAIVSAGVFPGPSLSAEESKTDTEPALEPLQVQRFPSYYYSQQPLTPNPEIVLRFSGPVDLEAVRETVAFVDRKGGRHLPVKTSRPDEETIAPLQPWGDDGKQLDWPEENFVTITPAASLPTEVSWQLTIADSLRSTDGKRGMPKAWVENLGTLYAFKINSITARNDFDSPKYIQISLNKTISDEIAENALTGFVGLQPAPENYRLEHQGSLILLHGDFRYGQRYSVSVAPGLIGHDETRLESEVKATVAFKPNAGFLSLPAYSRAQNASGAKRFDILSGNLKGIRVRIKQLTDRDLAYALRGYDELYGRSDQETIPYEMVPGKTILDREYQCTAGVDETEKLTLSWNEVLAGEKYAALYLCAEGWPGTDKNRGFGAQAIIQLTDIGLAWKRDRESTMIYAFSLKTGKPLPKLELETLGEEAEALEKYQTDGNGLVRIPEERLESAKWLAATRGKDRHIMEKFGRYDAIGLWQFSIPYRYDDLEDIERRVMLFTDRDVYQPGETAYLKGIVRLTDGDHLLPMAEATGKATVKVSDARGRSLLSQEVTLSDHGSFDLAIDIPEEKTLGWYSVEVDFNQPDADVDRPWKNQFHHGFQVAEYRPNTFEIDVDTSKADSQESREFSLPVSANYFMGKPLSKSRLNWYVSANPTWPQVRGFDDFRFGDSVGTPETFSASETLNLGGDGTSHIDFTLPEAGEIPTPMRVFVSAEITDINQQTIAKSTSFMLDSSDFYLGIKQPDEIVRAGQEAVLSLAAVNPDGEAHTTPVDATVKIEKLTYTTVKVKGAGGRITTRTETETTEILSKPLTIETRLQADTGLPIAGTMPLTLDEAGDYQVTVSATDAGGREARTRSVLRIFGVDEPAWTWRDGNQIDVTPDKESYQVGDVAKLLVRSPVLGNALVTVERAGVRETRVERIAEHETVIEVPVGEGSAPNLFASVLIVRGSADSPHEHPNTDYRLGYCELLVEDPAKNLKVAIEKSEAPYELPGAKVTLGARLTDDQGQPVSGAEITFYAVDEGVLSLTGYETPDPSDTFDEPFPLAVHTGQTISDLLPESPNDQEFGNKGYVIGGGGDDLGGLDPDRVRKNFQAVAFWRGALTTDAEGRVTTTFTAPDNLTSYRVIAVAAEEDRFASADARLIINKPLIIEPSLPAFGNAGDRMDLSAVLHNNTDAPVELEVRAQLDRHAEFLPEAEGLVPTTLMKASEADRPDLRVRRVTMAAGETGKVAFPALFTRKGEATWTWKASNVKDPALTDAVESKLEIGYPMPILRETHSFTIKREEEKSDANLLAEVNERLLTGRGEVKVTVSNSRVAEALDALDYLLHYPYGCVEQTTSSTLPWLTMRPLREALPQLDRSEAEVTSAIDAGTKRLLSMQTRDGGLSYWPGGDNSMLWGSAYGGIALALAKKQGVELPEERLDALWSYLSEQLRDTAKVKDSYDLYQRTLAAYTLALAGKSEPAYHETLYRKRAELSPDSRALLALAIMETAGENRDETVKDRVTRLLDRGAYAAEENSGHWYRRHFTTAMELMAWSRWDALGDRADNLLDELLGAPRGRAAWGSTYLNSWGLFAVTAHAEATASALVDTVATVRFGDQTREIHFGKQLTGELFTFEYEKGIKDVPLRVSIDSSARLFTHVEVAAQPEIVPRDPENHGLAIERTYHRLGQDGEVSEIEKALEVGDLVLVTLHLSVPEDERYQYLAIDDPLPAIFEAVNPNFETQSGGKQHAFKGNWKWLYCNHRELRKERALFFCDYLYRGGEYAVQYLARVVAPGTVTAPPAKLEAMYEPQRFGLSGTVRIVAEPLKLPGKNRVAKN
ncbi:MAG: hypothetical protein KDN19_18015 [Verrucomicrobiae bacterium]|nr:hypothetical protein [Verrucomicrobiae bacterium]